MKILKTAAIAMLTILPLGLAAPAMAQGQSQRVEHDNARIGQDHRRVVQARRHIHHAQRQLHEKRAARNHYAKRERQAARHGNYRLAKHFRARRTGEQRKISALHREIGHGRTQLVRDIHRGKVHVAQRNYDANRY